MKRRDFLKVGLATSLSSISQSGYGTEIQRGQSPIPTHCENDNRPNILLLLTDQQTLQAMSAAGNPWVNTPYMDSLVAKGVRFTRSYCTSPVCGPARSSLVTGRMPHEVGVEFNGNGIKEGIPNMGEIFRQAGYETVWIGKWHLPESYPRDENAAIPGFEHDSLPSSIKVGLGDVTDNIVADKAIDFLRWKEHKKPFLLVVSFHNPHDICWWVRDKPLKYANLNTFPLLPPNFAIDPHEPEFIKMCRERTHYGPELQYTKNWNEDQWRAYLHAYYHLTEQVDKALGRVLNALSVAGLEDQTLIVFTSDHGEGMAAHQWVVKLMLYEECVTVPLVICGKGITSQGVVDNTHLVSGMDILPTLSDYARIATPPRMTGMSLKPLIEQPEQPGRHFLISELSPDPKNQIMKGRLFRSQRYKYLTFSIGHHPDMLFDLENDPGETNNLAYHPLMKDVLEHHRQQLLTWIKQSGDNFKDFSMRCENNSLF